MDIISTQDLYDSFAAKYSIGTNSTARFTASFLGAYNDALMDLFNWETIDEPTLLTDLATDSALTIQYLPIVKKGIMHFLQAEGEWVKGEERDSYSELNWRRAKGDAANLLTRVNQWGE